ncbi:hypothetical protein Leryth_008782 [Lithospermum erythrorhizon]|uniref:Uncharacterized protein n=1 Tax=Lithospermum erythrorhizon TaxID=34254 RepID=A0AAV3PDE6_LITER|nr:hypothetical protein Leryth_008782 [Lithospermum erythrorhizon]
MMTCCFSFKSSSTCPSFKNIRVVHLNGCLEEFDDPLAVSEVTGNPSKHFVFTYAQLVSPSLENLKPDTILELGKFYFMIPHSTFQDFSSFDLVCMARRLAVIAKKGHCKGKGKSKKKMSSPEANRCCNRFSERGMKVWKPDLSTIREMSFNKRGESDLQEISFEKRNSL